MSKIKKILSQKKIYQCFQKESFMLESKLFYVYLHDFLKQNKICDSGTSSSLSHAYAPSYTTLKRIYEYFPNFRLLEIRY